MQPIATLRRSAGIFLVSIMLAGAASSATQRLERNPPLFGFTISGGEPFPGEQSDRALAQALQSAMHFGPGWLWRLEPGQWPDAFNASKMDPDGDGMGLNLHAAVELGRSAAASGMEIAPVLDSNDLLYLGKSALGQIPPPPRANFLAELSEHCIIPKRALGVSGESGAQTWHYRIHGDDWASDGNLRQFLADASALKSANSAARVILEAGQLATGSPDTCLERAAALKKGPAASAFDGLSLELIVDKPDLAGTRSILIRLQTTLGLRPYWIHSLRAGPEFANSLPSIGMSAAQAEAAYLSAAAVYARSLSPGGSVIFSLGQDPGSPMETAVRRLQHYLHPYHRAKFDFSDHVCAIAYSHAVNPTAYFVFWDWAADPGYVPGKTKSFVLPAPLDEYLAIPLVDDPPHWAAPRTLRGTKLGLTLELGRTPLIVEPAWIDKMGLHDAPPSGEREFLAPQ